MTSLFGVSLAVAMPVAFAALLLAILIISFRSRAVVFCQYLETMTGIQLKPGEVRQIYQQRGRNGVRELFLDLIIREDLKQGPIDPSSGLEAGTIDASSGLEAEPSFEAIVPPEPEPEPEPAREPEPVVHPQ